MNAINVIEWAGLGIAVGGITSMLASAAFCTRPAPRWMRNWMVLAWIMVGVRLFTRDNVPLDPGSFWVPLIWVHVFISMGVVAAYNAWSALGPRQDRCHEDEHLERG